MKNLLNILIKVSKTNPISVTEKEEIKKAINSSWEEFKNKPQEVIEKETINLANNHGFINSNYSECCIFLKNLYKKY